MWSLHPAVRNDSIYATLLERLDPKLARLPWARTNRALQGRTERADPALYASFNDYNNWIAGPFYDEFLKIIDPGWLAETGLFQIEQVRQLCESVQRKIIDPRYYDAYDVFVWLASLNRFIEWCNQMNIQIASEPAIQKIAPLQIMPASSVGKLRAALRSIPLLYRGARFIRHFYYRFMSIIKYPPIFQ